VPVLLARAVARPPQADAERTRKTVLAAASRLFSAAGVDGASMRDIAREAGVTQATVHHYFGNKEELYDAVVRGMYAELVELRSAFAEALGAGGDAGALVGRAVTTAFRFAVDHTEAVRMVMRQVVDTGEIPDEHRRAVLLPFLDQGATLLAGVSSVPHDELRMLLHTMTFLVVRYSLMSPAEMALVVTRKRRRSRGHDPQVLHAVEAHLARVALRLLGLPDAPPK
jgi:AcrR family transcriptional regulator